MEREALLALSQRKLNALGLPVCYIDAYQRYRFVNRAFLDWTGASAGRRHRPRGRRGRRPRALPALSRLHRGRARPASASASSASCRRSSAMRSGSASTTTPTAVQRGDVRGVLATYTDVDTIKRLELEAGEREHRLRIVTDSVGLPIFYFDRALRLRFANKPYGKYIGVAGRRSARPAAEELRRARRAGRDAGLRRARIRRRHGAATTGASAGVRRAALGARSRCFPIASRAARPAARSRSSTTSRTTSASARR